MGNAHRLFCALFIFSSLLQFFVFCRQDYKGFSLHTHTNAYTHTHIYTPTFLSFFFAQLLQRLSQSHLHQQTSSHTNMATSSSLVPCLIVLLVVVVASSLTNALYWDNSLHFSLCSGGTSCTSSAWTSSCCRVSGLCMCMNASLHVFKRFWKSPNACMYIPVFTCALSPPPFPSQPNRPQHPSHSTTSTLPLLLLATPALL